ncbi:MAG: hypothetical protein KDA98_10425 [Acidimicrobiales bacterium]|nr:hypothetical protein [Acidimicrobiales bacterium]
MEAIERIVRAERSALALEPPGPDPSLLARRLGERGDGDVVAWPATRRSVIVVVVL